MRAILAATGPDIATFVISGLLVLAGAIGVVTSRNAVHAALSLVLTLFGVAVLFIEQHAYFLAAVQVIVYAGAIVVLFLFVIMFLGVDRLEDIRREPLKGQRPLALLLVALALCCVLTLASTAHWVTGAHQVTGSVTAGHHTDTYLLGKSIFTTYLWAFEITAALLVIAVVGAVVLARRPSQVHETAEAADAEPGRPGSGAGPEMSAGQSEPEGAPLERVGAASGAGGPPTRGPGSGRMEGPHGEGGR